MKTNKSYKQKFQQGVSYEKDGGGHSITVPAVSFDYESVFRADEDKSAADTAHGQTRDEMDADLKRHGLSRDERKVVLLTVFDRKSTREIAADIGKSHVWVAGKLKRVSRGRLSTASAAGLSQAVQQRRERESKNLMRETTLTDAMNHAAEVLSRWPRGAKVDAGHIVSALEELGITETTDEKRTRVALVAVNPEILLEPQGRPFVEALVELIAAARYGKKGQSAAARKTLALFSRAPRGNRCAVPDRLLASQSLGICVALIDLQKTWREYTHDPIPARLDGVRDLIGSGSTKFSNRELLALMTGDLTTVAARVAQKVTGIASESFLRAWKKSQATRWIFSRPTAARF